MKRIIPVDFSLAERLILIRLENAFCGFCRAEKAAVDELRAVVENAPVMLVGGQVELHHDETLRTVGQPQPDRYAAAAAVLASLDYSKTEERVFGFLPEMGFPYGGSVTGRIRHESYDNLPRPLKPGASYSQQRIHALEQQRAQRDHARVSEKTQRLVNRALQSSKISFSPAYVKVRDQHRAVINELSEIVSPGVGADGSYSTLRHMAHLRKEERLSQPPQSGTAWEALQLGVWKQLSERVARKGEVHHPLASIETWREGCTNATKDAPAECQACTEGLIEAIEKWFLQNPAYTPFLAEIGAALKDETLSDPAQITAGIRDLQAQLEQAQATVAEMGGVIDDQSIELGNMATHQHRQKGGLYRFLGRGQVAGTLRTDGGAPSEVDVYLDTVSGQIYFRVAGEFDTAMVEV